MMAGARAVGVAVRDVIRHDRFDPRMISEVTIESSECAEVGAVHSAFCVGSARSKNREETKEGIRRGSSGLIIERLTNV